MQEQRRETQSIKQSIKTKHKDVYLLIIIFLSVFLRGKCKQRLDLHAYHLLVQPLESWSVNKGQSNNQERIRFQKAWAIIQLYGKVYKWNQMKYHEKYRFLFAKPFLTYYSLTDYWKDEGIES
jgi:hypothetical protein